MSTGIIDQAMDYLADFVNNEKWTTLSIDDGSAGVGISANSWKQEMSILVTFPTNTVYAVTYHLTKDQYTTRKAGNSALYLLNGCYRNANDYHFVSVKVDDSGVSVQRWSWNGTDQSLANAKLIVSYR